MAEKPVPLTYDPTEWQDGESGGTPINALRLNNIESGIKQLTERSNSQDTSIKENSDAWDSASKGMFFLKTQEGKIDVPASSQASVNIQTYVEGYKALCATTIVSGSMNVVVRNIVFSNRGSVDEKVEIVLRNVTNAEVKDATPSLVILYVKNTML